ncbi:MAG TPA: hypothetical protein VIB79_00950 [Candidatus Binatia bacterium]
MKRMLSCAILIGVAAATFFLLAASIVSAADTCNGGLCLPTRTWIARRLPDHGSGPCTATFYGSCKEVRAAFNYADGKIYYFAGDYSPPYWGSLYSYDAGLDKWATEYPHAGIPGDAIMDSTADEVDWSYDSKRNLFYWYGGFGGGPPCCYGDADGSPSPNGPIYKAPPLTYNPVTKKWTQGPGALHLPDHWAVYDPVTDRVYQAGNSYIRIINPVDGSFSDVSNGPAGNGGVGFGANNMLYDIDVAGRLIYLLNPSNVFGPWIDGLTRLYTFNLDTHEVKELARPPQQTGVYYPLLAFDSINRILFWWTAWDDIANHDPQLWIYHPDSNSWEKDPLVQPDGQRVLGNSLVFDPTHNVLVLMGSTDNSGDFGHGEIDHLFLYRYENGSGTPTPPQPAPPPPPPPVPPPPPSGPVPSTLQASFVGRDEDLVGQMNQTTADGIPDFHISLGGLRSTPVRVRVTSDAGGIWETPFNGTNWIIATQFNGSSGDLWFQPFDSNKFHVIVAYPDGTTDETDVVTAAPPVSTLQASYLGRDQDRVGQLNQTSPNGISDFHITVAGLRSTPVRVRIVSDTGGIWESPFNGANWIIATQFSGSAGDFWFEPFGSNSFRVAVTYPDGTTEVIDAAGSVGSALRAVFVGRDQDRVGQLNQTTPNGVSDFHISLGGLRSTPVRVQITSDTGGIWETPFNGANWIIATQFNGSAGDFWFEPVDSNRFHIRVTYPDGSTDEADAG